MFRAHKWLNLAAASHSETEERHIKAAKHRDDVAAKMTAVQIAEAQKLARGMEGK